MRYHVQGAERVSGKRVQRPIRGHWAEKNRVMKRLEDMTLEELREAVAKIDENEVREAAYDLLSRAEKLEKEVAGRIIELIGPQYDPQNPDA